MLVKFVDEVIEIIRDKRECEEAENVLLEISKCSISIFEFWTSNV